MSFYDTYLLPHCLNFACGVKPVRKQREKVVPLAEGRVLEVGMGSGLNIPYYNRDKIEFVWGLEPSEGMRRKARKNLRRAGIKIEWLDLPGEEIPLENNSVDSVLLTYTLCTIPDWRRALQQMRRVLKPDGTLVFCEHGAAPDPNIRKWQERVNPVWKRVAGGCHLNRPIARCLREGGFRIHELETDYLPGPKFATFNYWGTAKAARGA